MTRIVLAFLAVSCIISCRAQTNNTEKLDPDEFEKQISAGNHYILDVRTSSEFRSGHIAHALQADWTNRKEFEERISHLDKSSKVYVYCASGPRSTAAAAWLRKNGFENVLELKGGFINWQKNARPAEGQTPVNQMTMDEFYHLIPLKGIVLVDFGAAWCPPCVKMEPVLKEIEESLKNKFSLVKVEAGIHADVEKTLGVDSYPTFIIYKDGKETWRHTGLVEENILQGQLENQ